MQLNNRVGISMKIPLKLQIEIAYFFAVDTYTTQWYILSHYDVV